MSCLIITLLLLSYPFQNYGFTNIIIVLHGNCHITNTKISYLSNHHFYQEQVQVSFQVLSWRLPLSGVTVNLAISSFRKVRFNFKNNTTWKMRLSRVTAKGHEPWRLIIILSWLMPLGCHVAFRPASDTIITIHRSKLENPPLPAVMYDCAYHTVYLECATIVGSVSLNILKLKPKLEIMSQRSTNCVQNYADVVQQTLLPIICWWRRGRRFGLNRFVLAAGWRGDFDQFTVESGHKDSQLEEMPQVKAGLLAALLLSQLVLLQPIDVLVPCREEKTGGDGHEWIMIG